MKKLNKMTSDEEQGKVFGQMGVKCGRGIMNKIIEYLKTAGY